MIRNGGLMKIKVPGLKIRKLSHGKVPSEKIIAPTFYTMDFRLDVIAIPGVINYNVFGGSHKLLGKSWRAIMNNNIQLLLIYKKNAWIENIR